MKIDTGRILGAIIKAIRTDHGALQKEVSEEYGVSQVAWSNYEKGTISLNKFVEIAESFGYYDISIVVTGKSKRIVAPLFSSKLSEDDDKPAEIEIQPIKK